jgi:hypothetical protein
LTTQIWLAHAEEASILLHCAGGFALTQERSRIMNKDAYMSEAQDLPEANQQEMEDELLTEVVASDSTLGGSGTYREAGIGRFL